MQPKPLLAVDGLQVQRNRIEPEFSSQAVSAPPGVSKKGRESTAGKQPAPAPVQELVTERRH